jgi:hypothetical protein
MSRGSWERRLCVVTNEWTLEGSWARGMETRGLRILVVVEHGRLGIVLFGETFLTLPRGWLLVWRCFPYASAHHQRWSLCARGARRNRILVWDEM